MTPGRPIDSFMPRISDKGSKEYSRSAQCGYSKDTTRMLRDLEDSTPDSLQAVTYAEGGWVKSLQDTGKGRANILRREKAPRIPKWYPAKNHQNPHQNLLPDNTFAHQGLHVQSKPDTSGTMASAPIKSTEDVTSLGEISKEKGRGGGKPPSQSSPSRNRYSSNVRRALSPISSSEGGGTWLPRRRSAQTTSLRENAKISGTEIDSGIATTRRLQIMDGERHRVETVASDGKNVTWRVWAMTRLKLTVGTWRSERASIGYTISKVAQRLKHRREFAFPRG
ncbi:uncharacterized protein STEHIDRAFT_107399 [Stereum hirsutum FP-91666 SS1]|uniref:uncharacterized protein n=1 Tax=Stereum hirsutum (strain FP-91666) TaxID=721885 RepID=UPI0004410530|nr:uncharacterized protein STEHIDRAFT_107399 [Stereum hirsutum FP-91666 SS1]EIM90623.1 hypothetical protein STEHIDRAFT_107399 [Stereum hirsutum FP-91666 SS1]